ncbi:MAG: beta-ketoacyl-ACP synthase II [Chthoniobacterales bacterium]
MNTRRVVITGIGVISPVGNDLPTFWDSLKHGRSGVGLIQAFDTTGYGCKIAGEVKNFDPVPFFANPKDSRRADRFTQLGMAASKMAVADSGLDLEKIDVTRFGVIVGSGIGGLGTLEAQHTNLILKGPGRVSPFMIPMMISNMASGIISMEFNFQGPNLSVVSACATANNALGEAWRIIKFGDADGFLAGGSEAACVPLGISGFDNMKAMSTRNDDPERASRPFDLGRDGFVLSEGAGVLVLEEMEHAKARGARIYCELAGYGVTADAYHMSSPRPDGSSVARCMTLALKHAGVNPDEVDYINAHATSTGLGDIAETQAIKLAFGDAAIPANGGKIAVSSTKSMTGHTLGAAGAIEMAACIMAMRDGILPPTINLENQDPACDLDYVPNVAREAKVKVVVNNSFGFGGHNATLVATAFE